MAATSSRPPSALWAWLLAGPQRIAPPRRLRFTREGKFFVGITLGVGFAAINTANNLLYLLLGMLLALIVVSGIMSELSLRDLTAVRRTRRGLGLQSQTENPLVCHRGRGPSGRPAGRQALLLSEDHPEVGASR